jgi:NADH:ubiquinone oxidoreductase subunit 4 (subunit M)
MTGYGIFAVLTDMEIVKKKSEELNHSIYTLLVPMTLFSLFLCFVVTDIFYFFLLFEFVLIPLIIIIGTCGSRLENKKAIIFLVMYTLVGSVFLWASVVYLVSVVGSTDYETILNVLVAGDRVTVETRITILIGVLIGFAFKVPMVPFHP